MAKIMIDQQAYEVKDGQNLLQAALTLGKDLPYFCWHPALGSVGACRQCAVKQYKDENDEQGKLVMACMTPAAEGTRISIDDQEAREFRASIIEWMMVNHPHDCPICDEGGECHLQDMTVMTGHSYREYEFNKRTYNNQDLGPFINHEMNRCIQCYRCVRFYRDYAGGRDFDVFAAHDHVYFGRAEDGPLENEFSGNLIEICPTGVFTDKTFKKHYTRKWDLQTAPSLCTLCGLGCNTIPGERYGKLRRIRNRYNGEVNGYFLCDRGRFGYEFVNSQRRISNPLNLDEQHEAHHTVSKTEAVQHTASLLKQAKRVIGIGSPNASLESNFALRELVGAENFHLGLAENDHKLIRLAIDILQNGPARSPSLKEVEEADVVFVLGEDLINTAPRMALSLRQLVHRKASRVADTFSIPDWNDIAIREIIQHEKEMVFIATPTATKLDDIAMRTYRAVPGDLARLGFAVAHLLDPDAPAVTDLPPEVEALAREIAQALGSAEKPLVVSGTSCADPALIQAAANVAWTLSKKGKPAALAYTMPEANSFGLGLMGGATLQGAIQAALDGTADVLFLLENDLYHRASHEDVDALFDSAAQVIVLDSLENATSLQADVVLPAGTFAESDGTWVNSEGRAQRAYQVFVPEGEIQASWQWLRDLLRTSGRIPQNAWNLIDEVLADMAQALPVFAPVLEIAPPAGFRINGQKIPRQSLRFSGRTSIHANESVQEPQPADDPQTPLAFSMEGFEGLPPAPLIPRFWSPGWNSVQSLNKYQSEVGGQLRGGDPGKRLVEPASIAGANYFENIPAAFHPSQGKHLMVPLYHIFGSEPYSLLTAGIAERAPKSYLALNTHEAQKLDLSEGDRVSLQIGEKRSCFTLRIIDSLPDGAFGLPVGLTGGMHLQSPTSGKLTKSNQDK